MLKSVLVFVIFLKGRLDLSIVHQMDVTHTLSKEHFLGDEEHILLEVIKITKNLTRKGEGNHFVV